MIRSFTVDEIDGADAMLQRAFGVPSSFRGRLERYLAIEPEGWLVDLDDDGRVRGTVGAIVHGELAYVGLMGVEPGLQGRGIGRRLLVRLLEDLDARGVRAALLDATDAGAPLYESLGFVDAGPTFEWIAPAQLAAEAPALAAPDADALRDLDAALFGARRDRMWDRLLDERRGRILQARDGYLCILPEALGPWGARDPGVAATLLDAALAAGATPRALVPGDNSASRQLLEARGFTLRRTLRHMRRGAPRLDWRGIYGKASYCLG